MLYIIVDFQEILIHKHYQNPMIYAAVNISLYGFNYIIRRFSYIPQLGGLIG